MGLAGEALCALIPSTESVQSSELSQSDLRSARSSDKVIDRWLSPKEGASRLGISVRTLVRRSGLPPYRAFCIPQPQRGFKVSEQGLADFQRRERERALR
jgi:hypothetical protein